MENIINGVKRKVEITSFKFDVATGKIAVSTVQTMVWGENDSCLSTTPKEIECDAKELGIDFTDILTTIDKNFEVTDEVSVKVAAMAKV